MTKPADLSAYIFESQPHPLSGDLLLWMDASPRFTTFVETYRDKIRKKMRLSRERESALDLLGELDVACSLLSDRRLVVAYEPYASAKKRGPDFAVTFRSNLIFNIEVARIRTEDNGLGGIDVHRKEQRIIQVLLDKLQQMQPGMANLLVIHMQEQVVRSIDLGALLQDLKTRVEGKDPSFYAGTRYINPTAFYKDFLHLSGILLWAPSAQLWVNKQARPPLHDKLLRLIASLPSGRSQQA
ncbi:MAG: hypothetical protein ACXWNQ_09590 [Anaerolineales bacterium]